MYTLKVYLLMLFIYAFAAVYAATMYSPSSLAYFCAESIIFCLAWPWALEADKTRGLGEGFFKPLHLK